MEENSMANLKTADDFVNDVKKMKMTYSYIPVFIIAFFSECNENGVAQLDAIAQYYKYYYAQRRKDGNFVEKPDSIFCDANVSLEDVKRNILFNPLGRTFLTNYFKHSTMDNTIKLQSTVWETLFMKQSKQIIVICNERLNIYFQKLADNCKPEN